MATTRRKLMPHQANALRWAKSRRDAALFMQMRCGKTLTAARWLSTRPRACRNLIVSPLSVVPVWERELLADGVPPEQILRLDMPTTSRKVRAIVESWDGPAKYFITNPESLVARGQKYAKPSEIAEGDWCSVTFDESTRIRNARAKVTKVAVSHLSDAPYKCILSGKPNPEGAHDYVTQMLFLRREFMGHFNFWSWRQEHMIPMPHGGWNVKSSSLAAIRSAVREHSVFVTRKKAGIGGAKRSETIFARIPDKVRNALREAEKDFAVGTMLTDSKLASVTWQAQLCGGAFPHDDSLRHNGKTSAVLELLTESEFSSSKAVVWCRYNEEVEAMSRALRSRRISHVCVTGGSDYEKSVEGFNSGKYRVLVAQTKCLYFGHDLSAADVSIVFSNYYDAEVREQMEDRIVHPNKKYDAIIIDVVVEDSIDEDCLQALKDKKAGSSSFNAAVLEAARRRTEN